MKSKFVQDFSRIFISLLVSATLLTITTLSTAAPAVPKTSAQQLDWFVVVNNGVEVPGHPGRFFNSYNPPSVNTNAQVVLRARSTGQQQGAVSGIFTRNMIAMSPVSAVADRDTLVPEPNNTASEFNEFPAFPRIAINTDAAATRGNHAPVWNYTIGTDPDTGEPIETRVGTTGIYVSSLLPDGLLSVGASLLGGVPEFSPLFAVPGVIPTTRFDVFPGAPAITDEGVIAFKGNYSVPDPVDPTVTLGKTGVFYRPVAAAYAGGGASIALVANSDTMIPNPNVCAPGTTFGSTAPPSAVAGHMVFVGLDNEEDPSCGGIYRALMTEPPEQLTTLVGLETTVPEENQTFSRLGEGLSFNGRMVGFWGAWGTATRVLRLYCPQEGNRERRDYCNNTGDFAPDLGDSNSVCDDTSDPNWPVCYQEKEVPVNQGIFIYDNKPGKPKLYMLARTAEDSPFTDFLYWNYSGMPPGVGGSDDGDEAEPPRFRSAAFVAVSTDVTGNKAPAAFLVRRADYDPALNVYVDPQDGIYLASTKGKPPQLLVETGMPGTLLDSMAVENSEPMPITSLALERDAFRGELLAIAASMGVEEAGWGGIYLARFR